MREKTNSKVKLVYFNLDDEDELILFDKANDIKNFSKWVKKQLNGNTNQTKGRMVENRDDKIFTKENMEMDSMML